MPACGPCFVHHLEICEDKPTKGKAPKQWEEGDRARGSHNTQEYDETYGRHWNEYKEHFRPILYSTIGQHTFPEGHNKSMLRWITGTPKWKKLVGDTYRKRWPKWVNLNIRFFAEFSSKEFRKRTLLETASALPLNGVGCTFWRGERSAPNPKGRSFVASSVEFRQRPIHGVLRGTQFCCNRPILENVAPLLKSQGGWNYAFPVGAHPDVYRPPFPEPPKLEKESD
eukprot:CAMPEP_0194481498 /NCGR_PEP_ID=MMETSP0253-20130528/3896_1 /TAXON_ID=2966 /ORGANISM="Noctiluca scintillans" /LENGTH=225 /DNA_ID=CAMNT_0039320987 /DNA_START=59 /DNA_END=737 /DNA_ORIENTATION=+